MELFKIRIFLPLFSVRHFEAWGIRISARLPPPRTVLGALARGLGISLNIQSGEECVGKKAARIILTEAVEYSSYAFLRPISPLIKTSQILRIVPRIEQAKKIDVNKASSAHDAFKHDIIFSNEMAIIYAIDLVELNERLNKYGLRKVTVNDIVIALRTIDRIGPTEALCNVLKIERARLKVVESPATIDTYVPVAWVEPLKQGEQSYLIELLYPNLRLLRTLKRPILSFERSRKEKVGYILPIVCSKRRRGREIFEYSEVLVKPMKGYNIYSLVNAGYPTKVVLPENEVV